MIVKIDSMLHVFQCNHMATLILQYLAFCNNENFHKNTQK